MIRIRTCGQCGEGTLDEESPTAGAEDTRPAPEQLGTLLVKRGLISGEQLASALADQKAIG